MRFACIFLIVVFVVGVHAASAHEVRPGFLKIDEISPERFAVSWKQPVRGGAQSVSGLGLRPGFPPSCERASDSRMLRVPGMLVENFELACAGGLRGQTVGVEGLQKTITDVFVQLHALEGNMVHLRLTPESPAQAFGGGVGLVTYAWLGVEHLILGYDHILFVIGLVMLVAGWQRLVLVITGFTLAHSLTLGLSVLDVAYLPMAPVEATIALSILFVTTELLRAPDARSKLATRYPQVIALGFGLLHGFGFAGVLKDIGLPSETAILALALFNVGLEIGQLLVVAACLAVIQLSATASAHLSLPASYHTRARAGVVMAMGGLAGYWFVARSVQIIFV